MEEIFFKKNGKGQPILFIHGFCETHEIWNGFAEPISEIGEVYVIDLPGFGSSPLPSTSFSIDEIARKVFHWIDQRKIERPIVIGHSLGGYVALAMAAMESDKIGGLVLFHSTAFPDSEEKKSNRNRVMDFVKTNGVGPFIDTFVPGLFFDKRHAAIPFVDKIARKTSILTLLAFTAAMRDRQCYLEVYKKLNGSVLILAGDKDSIIPIEVTNELAKLSPRAEVKIFQETGHMAMFECPKEAQKAIVDFFLTIENKS